MKSFSFAFLLLPAVLALGAPPAHSRPVVGPHEEITADAAATDIVGDVDHVWPAPRLASADTFWIASWTFDGPGGCDGSGWQKVDNRIIANGEIHWSVGADFGGIGGIAGTAAILGYSGSNCCVAPAGYGNDWYEAIRLQYTGGATLAFDYLLDSEAGFDFLQVETDSACASFTRVDYGAAPDSRAAEYRTVAFADDGLVLSGSVSGLGLTDFGPGTHCVYIAFLSDGGFSPCDGEQPTTLGRALVVDNIELVDASGARLQDFEGSVDPGIFVELHDTTPFGEWGRLYRHITDNDACTENTTCAWLWTDFRTPTFANDPTMAFAPNAYVIRNWLDDGIVSPWVSLAAVPASGTVLRFRYFGGNFHTTSRIVSRWEVRGKSDVGGQTCVSGWNTRLFLQLNAFRWQSLTTEIDSRLDPGADALQIRHRVADRQWIAGTSPPFPFIPGPGPFVDDIRIGRVVITGPVLSEGADARSQAQDCFPTEIRPGNVEGTGEHHQPTHDRFGTCAFTAGADIGHGVWTNLITADSITIQVQDVRMAGGITDVAWYGAIVRGPHAGKSPAPYVVGANGFFAIPADSSSSWYGVPVAGGFFVDLDDTYFRGGDVVESFWLAADAIGGRTSDPAGLNGIPTSVGEAERATGGLLEVSFLPAIDWAPSYLARIAADAHGDLDPTATELSNSSQRHCILYVNHTNARRRSGAVNRTRFMYALDQLGYKYDVYDHSGMGNTNNHLAGRATVELATGYSLVVYDAGDAVPGRPIMPTGIDRESEKIDQAGWFRAWLAQAATAEAGLATLWVIGSNALEEHPTNFLYQQDMDASLVHGSQAVAVNPGVVGVAAYGFDTGAGQAVVDFESGQRALFALAASCASLRGYDGLGLGLAGTGVKAYRYSDAAGTLGDAALVLNSNPAANWNTILQSHPWSRICGPYGGLPTSPGPALDLAGAILAAVVPACAPGVPTGVTPGVAAPARTVLHPNVPNPFNPTTEMRFDLAASGRVMLRIYDVAGRWVRTLVDAPLKAGFGNRVTWNGLDHAGRHVPTGVYLARLEAPGSVETRKLLLLQ